jgi:metallo-beta-lactamase family protein
MEVQGPSIVVTGGGMCDGGPVVNYLSELLLEERNKLLFTGYCSPRTVGGKLLQLQDMSLRARSELSEVLRWNSSSEAVQLAAVRADISSVSGYSGHADHDGLLDWFFQWRDSRGYPAGYTTFLTHGDEHRRQKLAQALRRHAGAVNGGWEHNLDVQCPADSKDWFDLDRGGWIRTPNLSGCHYVRAAAVKSQIPCSTPRE